MRLSAEEVRRLVEKANNCPKLGKEFQRIVIDEPKQKKEDAKK